MCPEEGRAVLNPASQGGFRSLSAVVRQRLAVSSSTAPRPQTTGPCRWAARPPCWSSSSTPPVAVDSTTAGPRRHHRPAQPPRSALVSEPRRNGSLTASSAPTIEAKRPPLFSNDGWRYLSPWRLANANGRMVTTGGPTPITSASRKVASRLAGSARSSYSYGRGQGTSRQMMIRRPRPLRRSFRRARAACA